MDRHASEQSDEVMPTGAALSYCPPHLGAAHCSAHTGSEPPIASHCVRYSPTDNPTHGYREAPTEPGEGKKAPAKASEEVNLRAKAVLTTSIPATPGMLPFCPARGHQPPGLLSPGNGARVPEELNS